MIRSACMILFRVHERTCIHAFMVKLGVAERECGVFFWDRFHVAKVTKANLEIVYKQVQVWLSWEIQSGYIFDRLFLNSSHRYEINVIKCVVKNLFSGCTDEKYLLCYFYKLGKWILTLLLYLLYLLRTYFQWRQIFSCK